MPGKISHLAERSGEAYVFNYLYRPRFPAQISIKQSNSHTRGKVEWRDFSHTLPSRPSPSAFSLSPYTPDLPSPCPAFASNGQREENEVTPCLPTFLILKFCWHLSSVTISFLFSLAQGFFTFFFFSFTFQWGVLRKYRVFGRKLLVKDVHKSVHSMSSELSEVL